jgi:serine/threonine protein phosphatase PrpC
LKCVPLSEDHKPDLPQEQKRVEAMNGRVEPIIGPQGQYLGPARVWKVDEDTPGLAMSRSVGDGLAHSVGVSWEPEVKQLTMQQEDKFIVIASDGVWEFLSNENIGRIVWPFYLKNCPE